MKVDHEVFEPLERHVDVLTGFPFPSAQFCEDPVGPRLLRGSNIKRGHVSWAPDITRYWPEITPDLQRYALQKGDLVLALDGLVGTSFGTITDDDLPALLVQRVARLRAKSTMVQSYLRCLISDQRFRRHVHRSKTATGIAHISPEDVKQFSALIPPQRRQKAIGALADKLDRLLRGLSALHNARKTFKRGHMQQLLTGQKRFPEFRERPWSIHRFDTLCEELFDRNGKQLDADSVMGVIKGVGFEPMRDRVRGKGDLTRYKVVPPDGFAYNPMRLNIGSIAYNDLGRSILVSPDYEVFSARSGVATPEFVNQLRYSSQWASFMKRAGAGSVRVRIYFTDLARLRVPTPEVDEQDRIAEVLRLIDSEIDQLARLQDLVEKQKRALLSYLLSGGSSSPTSV